MSALGEQHGSLQPEQGGDNAERRGNARRRGVARIHGPASICNRAQVRNVEGAMKTPLEWKQTERATREALHMPCQILAEVDPS